MPTDNRLSSLALFLDVDGTLLDIAETPLSVRVDAGLNDLLRELLHSTGGALALVSGRRIAEMDVLFAPLTLPAAGLHGFERRDAAGCSHYGKLPSAVALEAVRGRMLELVAHRPGLLVEDKRFALALHYRRAPELESLVVGAMAHIAESVRPEFELQLGKMVAELRPAGSTKGAALGQFMTEAPFRGRYPIYIGDDLTDESAFEWINDAGGHSIAVNVGGPTAAQARLPSVGAVRLWLTQLCESAGESLRRPPAP